MSKEKKNKDKPKNKKFIIIGLILIILVGSFFIYQFINLKKPLESDWGQTYYVHLKDMKKKGKEESDIPANTFAKLKFLEVEDQKNPIMVITYQIKKENYTNVYYIENNKVNAIIYDEPTNIELLYNINTEKYDYYFHIEDENNNYYQSISNQIKENKEEEEDLEQTPEYTFTKEEEIVFSKFDQNFIKVETEDESYDYNSDLKEKELKEVFENSISNYQPKEEVVTEEIKEEVTKKVEENKAKLEELKKKTIEEIYDKLQGVWENETDDNSCYIVEFKYQNKKKWLTSGYFASEGDIYGEIKDLKLIDDNHIEFSVFTEGCHEDVCEIEMDDFLSQFKVDISSIKKNKITINDEKYTFVARNSDKAYDMLFEKYFN